MKNDLKSSASSVADICREKSGAKGENVSVQQRYNYFAILAYKEDVYSRYDDFGKGVAVQQNIYEDSVIIASKDDVPISLSNPDAHQRLSCEEPPREHQFATAFRALRPPRRAKYRSDSDLPPTYEG
jgi:hypothetical protein